MIEKVDRRGYVKYAGAGLAVIAAAAGANAVKKNSPAEVLGKCLENLYKLSSSPSSVQERINYALSLLAPVKPVNAVTTTTATTATRTPASSQYPPVIPSYNLDKTVIVDGMWGDKWENVTETKLVNNIIVGNTGEAYIRTQIAKGYDSRYRFFLINDNIKNIKFKADGFSEMYFDTYNDIYKVKNGWEDSTLIESDRFWIGSASLKDGESSLTFGGLGGLIKKEEVEYKWSLSTTPHSSKEHIVEEFSFPFDYLNSHPNKDKTKLVRDSNPTNPVAFGFLAYDINSLMRYPNAPGGILGPMILERTDIPDMSTAAAGTGLTLSTIGLLVFKRMSSKN